MIKIPIKPEYIQWAKQIIERFDAQKTYNKLETSNNYIGPLGELVFHKWLNKQGIEHKWYNFNKQGWDKPDFEINGKTIDLKTTFDAKMWIQKPEWDYYILARVTEKLDELLIIGYITKYKLKRLIKYNKLKIVTRDSRKDFTVTIPQMDLIFEKNFEVII